MNTDAPLVVGIAVMILAASGCVDLQSMSPELETVVVSRITDGDTFGVGQRRIRLLGIDSCESNTRGGQEAKTDAIELLLDKEVVLSKEPGVDKDRWGRELRYVQIADEDFGSLMVLQPHTGVYEGRNHANETYMAQLRNLDLNNGKHC